MKDLREYYRELYGDNDITNYRYGQLEDIIAKAKKERPAALKKADKGGSGWYISDEDGGHHALRGQIQPRPLRV